MATAVIRTPEIRTAHSMPIYYRVLAWMLIFPFVFFAVHGTPSFEGMGNRNTASTSLAGLGSAGRNSSLVGNILIPGLAFSIVLWLLATNGKRIVLQALQMKILSLLALLTICSALWSQDPFRSAYNGCFYLIETLFAFYLVLKFDPEEMLSLFMMAGVAISALCLIMVFLFPQFGIAESARDGRAWCGLFTDRTMAGKSMVFLLSPAILFRPRSFRYRHVIYILLMLLMVFMAHAATARVVSLLYIAFMASIWASKKFGRRSSLLITSMFATLAVSMVSLGLSNLPRLLLALGRNATLSGRTEIWSLVLGSIAKQPLLGYGYYAFWQGLKGESANLIIGAHWMFGYAHNGLLEICLQLGLVGTALFFLTLFQAIGNAWFCLRRGCPRGVEWYIGLIALTIMYNIDESTVLWPIDLLSILYLVACCGLAAAARKIKSVRTIEAMYR